MSGFNTVLQVLSPILSSLGIAFGGLFAIIVFALYGSSGYLRYTPIGWVHLALGKLIDGLGALLCENRVVTGVSNYLCYSPNPLMQLVWLGLVLGGYAIFLRDIYPTMGADFLPVHVYLSHVFVALTLLSFVVACSSDPGVVNKATVDQHRDSFPYDNLVYSPKECRTCLIVRPARSKHCRVCNRCVARLDHHCPWINTCVGERNTRWFLLFLFMTSFICLYEAYLTFALSHRHYQLLKVSYAQRVARYTAQTGKVVSSDLPSRYVLAALIGDLGLAVPLGLFCGMMGFVVFLFLSYHLYLIMSGTTTNETVKWADVRDWLDIVHYRRTKRNELLAKRAFQNLQEKSSAASSGGSKKKKKQKNNKQKKNDAAAAADDDDDEKKDDSDSEVDSIQLPTRAQMSNIYNRGIVENFKEVLFPISLRSKNESKNETTNETTNKKTD